tara:strand:- start:1695 stop:3545 length:1851 start_codon:yes stop_codon:yes gene_type:complete
MSIQIRNISQSITGLGRGIQSAQSSAKAIQGTLKRSIALNRKSMRISQETFLKRRDAVRRREQESLIEANTLSGATARQGSVAGNSTKGFLGRVMDFIGSILVAWAIKNLPAIARRIRAIISRIQRVATQLQLLVQNVGNFFNGLTGALSALGQNFIEFDFFDESQKFKESVDYMSNSVELMKGNIESGFNILREPIDFMPLEQAASGANMQPVEQQAQESEPTATTSTTTTAGSSMTYSSQGGTRITDPGGQDYGEYGADRMGSRGSSRVHGAGGEMGHTGEDYAMPVGKPLTMIAKGTVVDVGMGENGGYGNFVTIQLDNGMFVRMAHLDQVYVKKGQRVGAGSAGGGRAVVIGTSGNTGLSSGPHLHLDYAKSYDPGTAMVSQTSNPKSFIEGGGLVIGSNVKSSGQVSTTVTPAAAEESTPQQSVGRGKLSAKQIADVARQAGIPEDKIPTMVAIAMAESGGDSEAHNPKYPDNSFGLWQINMLDEPGYQLGAERRQKYGLSSNEELKDPLTNAKAAFDILNSQGLGAWSVYTSGKYKDFLPDAQAAISSTPRSTGDLQLPDSNNSINVPMPPGQSQQQSSGSASGGGLMGALNDAGQTLNRFITQRFLNNL